MAEVGEARKRHGYTPAAAAPPPMVDFELVLFPSLLSIYIYFLKPND